jgi:hypothetical protein
LYAVSPPPQALVYPSQAQRPPASSDPGAWPGYYDLADYWRTSHGQYCAASGRPGGLGSRQRIAYATGIITPADLLALTNQERAAAGLPALRLDARLNQSASLKAANMFAENYWAHVSPSGIQPWYWFTQAATHTNTPAKT